MILMYENIHLHYKYDAVLRHFLFAGSTDPGNFETLELSEQVQTGI